jgi:carboxylesterase
MPFQPDYEVPAERQAYSFKAKPREGWENVAILMLHGFMGSPVSSRDMGKFLSEKGFTVHCPLLPGHGNLPYMIHGYGKKDWIAEAEEGFHYLKNDYEQIFIIGHSMGAVEAAHLAHKYPMDVCGLILLAPLFDVPDWRIKMASFGRYFMPWFYPLKRKEVDRDIFIARVTDFDPTIDVDDPELEEWLVEATRLPMDAIDEMRKMSAYGRKFWPQIHQPAIIFQGGSDPAVDTAFVEKLFQKLATADKEMKFFPKAGHELMRPVEPIHLKVWQKILAFIEDHAEVGEKKPTPLNAPSLWSQKGEKDS